MATFRGRFNWYGEVHEFNSEANSKEDAKRKMIGALSKKVKRTFGSVFNYYSRGTANYDIKEVK